MPTPEEARMIQNPKVALVTGAPAGIGQACADRIMPYRMFEAGAKSGLGVG
jgi:NADP-dependent 3-hydroxy acid dehydrogenase YdfG